MYDLKIYAQASLPDYVMQHDPMKDYTLPYVANDVNLHRMVKESFTP